MALTTGANAQLLFEETFNYVDGALTLTSTGSGANVSGGNWITNTGTGSNLTVGGTGLTYSGYASSNAGKKITLSAVTGSAEDAYRQFTTQSTGTIYASFLINVANTTNLGNNTSVGNYFAAFIPSTSTSSFFARVSIRAGSVASTVNFGIIAVTGQTPVWIPTDYAIGTTYLVVFSYQFVSGANNDVASLWVNPPLSGTPSADVTQTATGTEQADCARIQIRQGATSSAAPTTPNADISGIRVATDWSQAPLPVELTSFTANVANNRVQLAWATATETQNVGFDVERKSATSNWAKIGFVSGNGTANAPHAYSYADNATAGTYSYRLKQIDRDGKFEYSPVVEVKIALTAADYTLQQNYPNPFNPATVVRFAVPTAQKASLKIYNSAGQEVATLFNGMADAGRMYELSFDGSHLASGVYFSILQSGDKQDMKKMTLLR